MFYYVAWYIFIGYANCFLLNWLVRNTDSLWGAKEISLTKSPKFILGWPLFAFAYIMDGYAYLRRRFK